MGAVRYYASPSDLLLLDTIDWQVREQCLPKGCKDAKLVDLVGKMKLAKREGWYGCFAGWVEGDKLVLRTFLVFGAILFATIDDRIQLVGNVKWDWRYMQARLSSRLDMVEDFVVQVEFPVSSYMNMSMGNLTYRRAWNLEENRLRLSPLGGISDTSGLLFKGANLPLESAARKRLKESCPARLMESGNRLELQWEQGEPVYHNLGQIRRRLIL